MWESSKGDHVRTARDMVVCWPVLGDPGGGGGVGGDIQADESGRV